MAWRTRCSRSRGEAGARSRMFVIAPSELNWVAPLARISSQKPLAEKRGETASAASAHKAA